MMTLFHFGVPVSQHARGHGRETDTPKWKAPITQAIKYKFKFLFFRLMTFYLSI